MIEILHGDNRVVLKTLADNSVDSIVTDPPYELGFMGKHWDKSGIAYDIDLWRECLRVLKPGGHLLSFGGTRTYHRMACAIEDAGFEIRDQIQWIYGSGFPKSLDISKQFDKINGTYAPILVPTKEGNQKYNRGTTYSTDTHTGFRDISTPVCDEAQQWEGWGTALKPANEPICLARKPLSEKTVASNVLKWGTGGLNIDGCRIETNEDQRRPSGGGDNGINGTSTFKIHERKIEDQKIQGRFPANVIHDGSDEVLEHFPNAKGQCGDLIGHNHSIESPNGIFGVLPPRYDARKREEDNKSASRFFYCAKASKSERNMGLEEFELKEPPGSKRSVPAEGRTNALGEPRANHHPTVKPVSLMRYLCRLITPPKGIVLDPFCGSGSTGIGAKLEGFSFIGIEKEPEYVDIAKARIEAWKEEIPPIPDTQGTLF